MSERAEPTISTYRYKVLRQRGGPQPSFGAKCSDCGAWLTKWDFTAEDAAACAREALIRGEHECRSRGGAV